MEYFVYVLSHTYTDEWHTDSKLLGFLNSLKGVEEMKKQAFILPGFKEYPECFVVNQYILDKIHWAEGFHEAIGEMGRDYLEKGDEVDKNCRSVKELELNNIFSVSHYYTINTHLDDERYIGVFSSLDQAEKAVEILKMKPGFKSHPDGFDISELDLNVLLWNSGF
ncbi:hypothetical protein N6B72_08460 [Chryseobacterium soli]|uniref:DUF7336 domain-containing protein n=1 Tax=Chryseobacterium soli TaxID=445961 RepID=UPI002952DCDC|nr:hypothetical protein [Chryseobacterium soli]MDV7696950.1 hypothetical protein [Chryseobacterium soli]